MLVNTSARRRRENAADDVGSTLISVMVIVFVLGLLAVTLSAAVMNTTQTTMGVRSSLQSQSASDAGLAAAVAAATATGADPCTVSPSSAAAPEYTVTAECSADVVTFTSTGTGGDGTQTITTSTFALHRTASTEPTAGADMVFFGDATFTSEVRSHELDDRLLTILMPQGNFVCQNRVPANLVVGGNVTTNGGCTVEGTVAAGGNVTMTTASDVIQGNLYGAGTATARLEGTVLGDIHLGGGITFGWSGRTYPGDVQAGGSVNLTNVSIGGSLTLPSNSALQTDGWINVPPGTASHQRIAGNAPGGLRWPASVAPPEKPAFQTWFEYRYAASDWPGYAVRTLSPSGNGAWTCNRFNANNPTTQNAAGWRELSALTAPTIVDARPCGTLSANNGSSPVVSIQTDVLFLADNFDLTHLTLRAADGTTPRVWWVVEDRVADGAPTCVSPSGTVTINTTVLSEGLSSMIYTPCRISVTGGGEWHGAFYGGGLNHGGMLDFHGKPLLLPGQGGTGGTGGSAPGSGGSDTVTLGDLISRTDGAR